MASTLNILGQQNPTADTDTTLYTVPASTSAIVAVRVCNTGTAAAQVRLAARENGDTLAAKHYLAHSLDLDPGQAVDLVVGLALNTTDVLTVRADTGDVAFTCHGEEIT